MAGITAGVAEVGSVPAENYISQYFVRYPTDTRFANVSYAQFNSVVSLDKSNELIFVLPPLDAPMVYDISDVLLKVQIKITTEDGKKPDKGKLVIPVNNSCLSCFESLSNYFQLTANL